MAELGRVVTIPNFSGFRIGIELGMDSYQLYTVLINQNHNNLILHFLA